MSKPDGGPAFPQNQSNTTFLAGGMTLRDYFAAAALPAIVTINAHAAELGSNPNLCGTNSMAFQAYEIADVMISERDK